MTIVNRTYGFIFIHVPKTGGTSVKEHLSEYGHIGDAHIDRPLDTHSPPSLYQNRLRKHSTAREVRKVIGRAEYDRLFKFCVVRNPFIRTLSLFRFLKFSFRAWPRADVMDKLHTLEEFVLSPIFVSSGPGGIIAPQIHWLTGRSGARLVDYVARVETLQDDLLKIRTHLKLPTCSRPLARRNTSKGNPDRLIGGLMSGNVVDAIRNRYASDFENLNYGTDPAEAIECERRSPLGIYAN